MASQAVKNIDFIVIIIGKFALWFFNKEAKKKIEKMAIKSSF